MGGVFHAKDRCMSYASVVYADFFKEFHWRDAYPYKSTTYKSRVYFLTCLAVSRTQVAGTPPKKAPVRISEITEQGLNHFRDFRCIFRAMSIWNCNLFGAILLCRCHVPPHYSWCQLRRGFHSSPCLGEGAVRFKLKRIAVSGHLVRRFGSKTPRAWRTKQSYLRVPCAWHRAQKPLKPENHMKILREKKKGKIPQRPRAGPQIYTKNCDFRAIFLGVQSPAGFSKTK